MRYSRYALLLFGTGLLLGLVVVSAKLPGLARLSSGAMAAGIVLLPIAAITDWRRRAPQKPVKKGPRKASPKPRRPASAARRATRKRSQ